MIKQNMIYEGDDVNMAAGDEITQPFDTAALFIEQPLSLPNDGLIRNYKEEQDVV